MRRRAFLVGLGAGAAGAVAGASAVLLPPGVNPYPVPEGLIPESFRGVTVQRRGIYYVTFACNVPADLIQIGVGDQEVAYVHSGVTVCALVHGGHDDIVTATAFMAGAKAHEFRADFRICRVADC